MSVNDEASLQDPVQNEIVGSGQRQGSKNKFKLSSEGGVGERRGGGGTKDSESFIKTTTKSQLSSVPDWIKVSRPYST